MGNQSKQNRSLIDTQMGKDSSAFGNFTSGAQNDANEARTNSTGSRSAMMNMFSNPNGFGSGIIPNSNGMFDTSGFGLTKAPHAGADFSEAKGNYQNFANTGGINKNDFNEAMSGYRGFASDGGLSDADKGNMRYRATSMVPSFFQGYKNALANRQNVQGGYSPGYDAQMQQIGRDASSAGYDASRKAEADIADKVQQGREFGVSGMGDLTSRIAGMEQSGKEFGTSGLNSVANSEMQNNQFNSGLDADYGKTNANLQLELQKMYQQGNQFRASGLKDIYGQDRADYQNAANRQYQGISGGSNSAYNGLGLRSNIKGIDWGKWAGAAASGLGTAAMFM